MRDTRFADRLGRIMNDAPRIFLFALGALAVLVVACSEPWSPGTREPASSSRPELLMSPSQCGVSYTVITSMTDSAALTYGAPSQTDTSTVCETWTGTDYNVQLTQVGSSEPASEYSEDVKTVTYTNGQATPYAADNSAMETGSDVGASSFEFGQATPAEQQASYNDPYYGIAQDSARAGCPGNPTAIVCDATVPSAARQSGAAAPLLSIAGGLLREHNLRRKALRALMSDKEEIAPSLEGFRRFRAVVGDEETIISIDPLTELMREQETTGPGGHVKAKLSWRLDKGRFIRDRMEVESEEKINEKLVRSFAVISVSDVRFAGGR